MKRFLILVSILIIALFTRLYKVSTPLADWHSWRQADTAAVTRLFVQNNIDLLHPKYDDLSNIPSGLENPQGYRMVEFPFINGLTAWLYQIIPGADSLEIHIFSRIISIVFSLGSIVFLYLLVNRLTGQLEAALAATVFALLPYNIFYSRTILPEVPLVFFTLAELYFATKYFTSNNLSLKNPNFWLAGLSGALAMLLKPYAIFLGLPLLYLGFKKQGLNLLKDIKLYLYLVIIFLPFGIWRNWIKQFPEGIPAFMWLLNGNNIRFKGAWFRWLFADRIGRLILGYFGLIPLGLGLIKKPQAKEGWFFYYWLLGIILFLTVFATGNVQHDYYQIITIPIISIFVAKGLVFLVKPPNQVSKSISYLLFAICSAFTLAFSWFHIRDFYNINHPEIVEAGKAADQILKSNAKVIAPYSGDTAFLYQINRRGWPIGGGIQEKIKLGATDYVTTVKDDEANKLLQNCPDYTEKENFTIISLQNCNL